MNNRQRVNKTTWRCKLRTAIQQMLEQPEFKDSLPGNHFDDTPERVVKAFEEYFAGVYQDPAIQLQTSFEENSYDQMIVLADVDFVSHCAHHFSPFLGTYTFAYLPDKKIVGLSKIPRMVEVLCARPQVQENLTQQVVKVFQDVVSPKGCGLSMDAVHTCACIRGVKKKFTTRTVALAGAFATDASTKAEFLSTVRRSG